MKRAVQAGCNKVGGRLQGRDKTIALPHTASH